MNKQIFRKVSLERLSSPEQLDTLVQVTSRRGWLALTGIGLLLAAALYWGFFGSMPTKIGGQGVLIRPGGLQTVYASASGPVTDIRVKEHDVVNKGDVIARIEQPALLDQLKQARAEIARLQQSPGADAETSSRLAELEQSYDSLKQAYELASRVVSLYDGRVQEIKVNKGGYVQNGSAIVAMETGSSDSPNLQAVLYVPVQEGKKLLPGMEVAVAPDSVSREQYGFMIGKVLSVSEFPVTQQGMMVTLGNEGLVQQMSTQGVALEVRVDLVPDSRTVSGYAWSTSNGPPVTVDSGTLVQASITVSTRRPISTVLPQFK